MWMFRISAYISAVILTFVLFLPRKMPDELWVPVGRYEFVNGNQGLSNRTFTNSETVVVTGEGDIYITSCRWENATNDCLFVLGNRKTRVSVVNCTFNMRW